MTEEEAKTKWCPFVRHSKSDASPPSNRQSTFGPSGFGDHEKTTWNKCIASQCMAWRTVVTHGPTLRRGEPAPEGMTAIMGNDEVTCYAQIDNYCGLAGKP